MCGGVMLICVVGPSGAGKDTLLDAARQALTDDHRFRFVRRVITRPAEAGGEAHEAATETEFAQRDFALKWQAHGLSYGIPAAAINDVAIAVASVSRTVIADAAERFPVRVIEVTAPPKSSPNVWHPVAVRAPPTSPNASRALCRCHRTSRSTRW